MRLRLQAFDEVASDRYARQAALAWIAEHPLRWAGLGFVKIAWMALSQPWHPPFLLRGQEHRPAPGLELMFKAAGRAAGWLAFLGFVGYLMGLARALHRRDGSMSLLGLVPLAAWAVIAAQSFVFHGLGRFREPVEGLIILCAAYALLAVTDRRQAGDGQDRRR